MAKLPFIVLSRERRQGAPKPPAIKYADPPCQDINEVIRRMDEGWQSLHRSGDWRAVFAKTYLRTTEQILVATQQPGTFENSDWIVELDCHFAQRYFQACDAWEDGRACPAPWALAFEHSIKKNTLVTQDILLGMNAHINYDLPYSLNETIPMDATPEQLASYRRDHEKLNQLLGGIVNIIQGDVAGHYSPALSLADRAMGEQDEAGANRLLRLWRSRSWANFRLLRNAEDPVEANALVEGTATEFAHIILEVQRIMPRLHWPNRMYRDSVYWVRRRRSR